MRNIFYVGITFLLVILVYLIINKMKKREIKLTENPYNSLRYKVFNLSPETIGINLDDESKIFCSVMEIGFPDATATLVSYIDGNASLYLSSGGGVIGGFAHENVRNAAVVFVNESQGFMQKCDIVQSYSLPQAGHIIFYLMSKNEVYSSDLEEIKLQNNESEFTKLYVYGQNVITELRKIAG